MLVDPAWAGAEMIGLLPVSRQVISIFLRELDSDMQQDKDTMEIDLLELAGVLLHRAWLIILAAIIGGGIAFGYTFFMVDPLYKASALMYVNNSDISVGGTSFSISNADLTAAQKLVDTYVVILKSRTSLNEVIDRAELPYSYEKLKHMVSASGVNSTEIFEVGEPQEEE